MALLDRHIGFVEALRAAGLPVSLSEDLDAVAALDRLGVGDRETLRAALASTLVKRQSHRAGFDALFDLYFPARVGTGRAGTGQGAPPAQDAVAAERALVEDLRERVVEALTGEDGETLERLAVEGVDRFGAIPGRGPGRGPGQSAWSSFNTLQRLNPDTLVLRLSRALAEGTLEGGPRSEVLATRTATRRVDGFRRRVEAEVRRRIAEDRGPEQVARSTLRPPVEQIAFTAARREEIDEMRRQVYPLARRLATRLAKEQHHRRRGPLDFRRTVRAAVSTGGVPLVTHHRPRRPHRPELVVLCDVSGSVASFAHFTLLLVHALHEQFSKVRAFTFVDDVHEVTDMERLAESARSASMWGRTDYGRAFTRFQAQHADALSPRASLLVLGDARSNYTDPRLDVLAELVGSARQAWWLNPEHRRQWDTGDSAASRYADVLPMVECRNLTQLAEFVHDLL